MKYAILVPANENRERDVAKMVADHQFQHAAGGAGGAPHGLAPAATPGQCMLLQMRNQSENMPLFNSSESVSSSGVNRRDFIKTTSLAAGALAFGVPTLLRGQNLNAILNWNVACIGAMGAQRQERYRCLRR